MVRKIKPTIPATPFVETIKVEAPEPKVFKLSDLLPEGATWKRTLTAWTLGLLASFGTGYGIGVLLEMLIIGAATLTNSLFVVVVLYILGICLSMYLGSKVAKFVYLSVMNKRIDACYFDSKNWVTEMFGNNEPCPVQS